FRIEIKSENGSSFDMSGLQYFAYLKPGQDHVVTVQFRSRRDANPELFRSGRIYSAEVSGLAGLNVSGNANDRTFAGSGVSNPAPRVTHISPVNGHTIIVHFSEPVRGVGTSVFRLTDPQGQVIPIVSSNA